MPSIQYHQALHDPRSATQCLIGKDPFDKILSPWPFSQNLHRGELDKKGREKGKWPKRDQKAGLKNIVQGTLWDRPCPVIKF